MSSIALFHSALADHLAHFVAYKQMNGYDYGQRSHLLAFFDRFWIEEGLQTTCLCSSALERYIIQTAEHKPQARKEIIGVARQFSEYMHAMDPHNATIPIRVLPEPGRRFRFCRQCGFQGPPKPRLYDLRHNYACQCLRRWRRTGEDIHALLPVLAAAMGHVNYLSTQVYIHIEPYALEQAAVQLNTYRHSYERNTQ